MLSICSVYHEFTLSASIVYFDTESLIDMNHHDKPKLRWASYGFPQGNKANFDQSVVGWGFYA